ncbi:ribosomal protein S18-alanine N-acetyltransferase [bacterium]|nr:ribosomal protein S18-alanine N-acetyltransferase [bacterium]
MKIVLLKDRPDLLNSAKEVVLKYSKYDYITEDNLNYLLLDNDDVIIGEIDYSLPLGSVDLLYIYIKEEYRGRGLSKYLLNESIEDLQKKDVKEIFLEVSKINIIALNLYNKMGFQKISERKNYYEGNIDAIIMKKTIG